MMVWISHHAFGIFEAVCFAIIGGYLIVAAWQSPPGP